MKSDMSVLFLNSRDIIKIKEKDLDKLERVAAKAPLRRARYCLHNSHNDTVQEMVIAFCKDSSVPVHRHRNKSESFHVIRGELEVVFYDDDGNIIKKIKMGTLGSGLPFLYRLSNDAWHTVRPLTEYVIVHETASGPFNKEEDEILKVLDTK